MSDSTRFQSAILTARPRGARLIETYSPKLGRRLQCYSEAAFSQWIRLEADPLVQTFCERPVLLNLSEGTRPADFWVIQESRESLLLIDDNVTSFVTSVGAIELPVRVIPSAELAAARVWIGNWSRMLPTITACRELIPRSLQNAILKFVSTPMQLSRIEQEFVTGDPTLVRAAVFGLLHRGQLDAPALQTEALSYLTVFQPGRAAP